MPKFLNNINLEQANDIQFKTTAGANAGKISQDGTDLVLTNAVGDIIIGNGNDDVYIGDGVNNVDIRFEQNMAIYADSASTRTLTLGGANTSLILEDPTLNNPVVNSKMTFGTANGYILFDYEPPGDTGEYTTEVPLLKVDLSGSETTILSRVSEYRGVALGADDTVWLRAGDTGSTIKANVNLAAEQVVMSAEGGFIAYGFPGNDTTWSNRVEFQFRTDSTTASNNGLYIGDGSGTQFIDLDRNLKNLGAIYDTNGSAGTAGQILSSTGSAIDWIDNVAGSADKALSLTLTVKNTEAVALSKGDVVCAAPSATPPSGNVIEIKRADNNGTNSMPAIGILNGALDAAGGANDEGEAIMFGRISGIDTSAFSVGDELFVSDSPGGLTPTKPTGVKYIQKVGVVMRDDASNGTIEIFGAGRTNDVPTPLYVDHANQRLGIGTASPQEKLDISAGSIRLDDNQKISWSTSDSNIGRVRIYGSEPNDFIAFATDNSERMRLTNTGLVIGTTSPSQKLHVDGNIRVTGAYYDSNNSSGTSGQVLSSTATGTDWITLNDIYYTETEADARFVNVTGDTMTGTLTISTTNPVLILNDTNSTGTTDQTGYISFQNQTAETGWIGFGSSGSSDFTVRNTSGNVVLNASSGVVISNGNLSLNGTGRIQGVDTVSAGTDAVNKTYVDTNFASSSHTHAASDITSGTFDSARIPSPTSGDWWNNGYVKVLTDGVMEVGKYFDMHATDTATSDYDVRLTASTGSLAISGDLVVSGGDITLSGTGRIQGIDTVSAGTDAVNKTYVDTNFAAASHTHDSDYVNVTGDTMTGDLTLDDNSGASPSLYLKNGNNNFWRLFCGSSEDLTFRLGTVTKLEIDSSGNASFAGNVTLNSRLTFDYGGYHYFEAGTNSLSYKSSGGTSVMTLNASTQAATFAGDVTLSAGNIIFGSQYGVRFNDANTRIYTNVETPEDLIVEADQDLLLQPDGNVGIGTTSPATTLEVAGVTTVRKSGTATPHADTDLLVTDATAALSTAQVQILGGNAGSSNLKFSDTDAYSAGSIDYSHSADSMSFRTNSTIQTTITSSGNVGIGTTNPGASLHVGPSSLLSGYTPTTTTLAVSDITNGAELILRGQSPRLWYDITSGGMAEVYIDGAQYNILSGNPTSAGSSRFYIKADGNIGIGTTSPGEKLHLKNNGDVAIALENQADTSGNYWKLWQDNWNGISNFTFNINYGGTDFLTVNTSGNVGIGTTSPTGKFNSYISAARQLTHNGNGGDLSIISDNNSSPVFYVKGTGTADLVNVYDNTNEVFTIKDGGNVGIGTTSPNHKLDIYSNENVPLRIHRPSNANLDSSGAWGIGFSTRSDAATSTTDTRAGIFSYYNGDLFLAANNSSIVSDPDAYARLTVLSTGNVGIGTISPKQLFHVHGGSTSGSVTKAVIGGTGGNGESYLYLAEHFSGDNVNYGFSFVADGNSSNNLLIKRHSNSTTGNTVITVNRDNDNVTFAGTITATGGNSTEWNTAYDNSIVSAAVTGTTTKTLTLNQQDGGTVTATWTDADSGVTGSGATNYLTYWDSASTIDDTNISYTTNGGLSIDNSSVNTRSYNLTHTGEDTYSLRHGGANGGFSVYNTTDVRTEMLFDGTGNVGIGTAAPGTKLTVDGVTTSKGFRTNTANTGYNLISRNSAGNATLYVQSATSDTNQPIAQFNHGSATVNTGTQVLRVAKDQSYFINTDLGIGTSTPAYPLDVTGNVRLTGDLYVNGGQVYTSSVQARVKYSVWTDTTYGIGMQSGYNYGHLNNDYAMSFQMNSDNDRGFWWGDNSHTNSQGAMSLTTQGKATIATSLSVGEGETITSPSDKTLHVEGETETTNLSYPYPTATDQFHGEIVTFGSFNGTIVAGDVIVYTTAGVQTGWFLAQGNVTYSKGMLGIAMGTTPSAGILIKGFARHASFASGNLGSPLYLSPTTAGDTTNVVPSSTNNIVRIVGYMLNPTNDEIFFDPDKSWVQVS